MQSSGGAQSARRIRLSARKRISVAALFVKVSVKVLLDGMPTSSIKYARRVVSVFVFPLPAPAKISNAPSKCVAAACCSGFNPLRMSLIDSPFVDSYDLPNLRLNLCDLRRLDS